MDDGDDDVVPFARGVRPLHHEKLESRSNVLPFRIVARDECSGKPVDMDAEVKSFRNVVRGKSSFSYAYYLTLHDDDVGMRLSKPIVEALFEIADHLGYRHPNPAVRLAEALRRSITDEKFLLDRRQKGWNVLLRRGDEWLRVVEQGR